MLLKLRKLMVCGLWSLVPILGSNTVLSAQATQDANARMSARAANLEDVRIRGKWELGPFLQGGTGVGTRSDFQFFAVGFQAGRSLTPVLGSGFLRGRFELAGNVMPLWQAYTPAARTVMLDTPGGILYQRVGGGTFTGASITPVIFRWNFAPRSAKWMPWVQAAGGLIYTTHKFPPTSEVPHGLPGGTSVFNFSPQGGGGVRYFIQPRRSIDFGVNAVHISSASLGDKNPGVNASMQFTLGYTWWK